MKGYAAVAGKKHSFGADLLPVAPGVDGQYMNHGTTKTIKGDKMLYIINNTDCPDEKHLVYELPDGSGKYLSKRLRSEEYHFSKEQMAFATSLDTFGFTMSISDTTGKINCVQTRRSKAKYTDGKFRPWQGREFFAISIGEIAEGVEL